MWKWLKIILGTVRSSVRSQRELALDNLALRQQLAILKFRGPRPKLTDFDLCVANSNSVASILAKSKSCHVGADCYDCLAMRHLAILFVHFLATIAKLMLPGGGRAVVAESLLLKHQLMVLNRGRDRAQPPSNGSRFSRPVRALHSSAPVAPCCCRIEAFYPPRFPRRISAPKSASI